MTQNVIVFDPILSLLRLRQTVVVQGSVCAVFLNLFFLTIVCLCAHYDSLCTHTCAHTLRVTVQRTFTATLERKKELCCGDKTVFLRGGGAGGEGGEVLWDWGS